MIKAARSIGDSIRRAEGELAYRQIYERVRSAILAGELGPGTRLPSARSMASQLAVARGTVEAAYQLLQGEGYVVARGAAGTFVESAVPLLQSRPPKAPSRSEAPR